MDLNPTSIVTTDIVSKINVKVMRIELFTSATLYVSLTTDTGKTIKSEVIEISGDDYINWKNDDSFLYSFAAQKLGYTVQPVATTTTTSTSAPDASAPDASAPHTAAP